MCGCSSSAQCTVGRGSQHVHSALEVYPRVSPWNLTRYLQPNVKFLSGLLKPSPCRF